MTTRRYFSERERGRARRVATRIDSSTAASLVAIVNHELLNPAAGSDLPKYCDECDVSFSANQRLLSYRASRDIRGVAWDSKANSVKITNSMAILDLLEMCYEMVVVPAYDEDCDPARPNCGRWVRRKMYRDLVNRILERDLLAYELNEDGQIARVGAPILSDAILDVTFQTGDGELDEMLEMARDKFVSRNPATRREGLEKLWDAWERLKSIETQGGKGKPVDWLLDQATTGDFRPNLEAERSALDRIGNEFQIRHFGQKQKCLDEDHLVDYLFHRMFSMIYLLLDATGRLGRSD